MVKISIIVPIYNTGRYLRQCVDSLLAQTLQDFEIILVDDESPDDAPQICEEYVLKDTRIKAVHKKNGGLGFARNTGLDIAAGEYVSFIDSDDFVAPEMMETLYNTAKAYDADEVRSGTIFYNNGKRSLRRDVEELTVYKGPERVKEFIMDLIGPRPEEPRDVKFMMSVCLALHKRSVIEEYHVRFTSERESLSEDLIFDLDLFPHMNCIVCIPDCFYYYRMNPLSLTHTYSMEKYSRTTRFFEFIRERLDKSYSEEDYLLHFQRLMFLYLRNSISNCLATTDTFKRKLNNVKYILNDSLWNEMIESYPYHRMEWKHRIYFFLVKRKWVLLIMSANKYFLR